METRLTTSLDLAEDAGVWELHDPVHPLHPQPDGCWVADAIVIIAIIAAG